MGTYLGLRFDAPMQAWGGVAVDPRRPSDDFPRMSAVGGLLANALGWRHGDADRITALQDSLDYAVREDRPPSRMWDFQTADLSQLSGWTRWGPESPGGGSAKGTHILNKEYLADAVFTVALGLAGVAPVSLDELEGALKHPARPLFLGRKSCIPSGPILVAGRVDAASAREALAMISPPQGVHRDEGGRRTWYDADAHHDVHDVREVWDRRDYRTGRFDRMRRVARARAQPPGEEAPDE